MLDKFFKWLERKVGEYDCRTIVSKPELLELLKEFIEKQKTIEVNIGNHLGLLSCYNISCGSCSSDKCPFYTDEYCIQRKCYFTVLELIREKFPEYLV
jgi:hypothetical protein